MNTFNSFIYCTASDISTILGSLVGKTIYIPKEVSSDDMDLALHVIGTVLQETSDNYVVEMNESEFSYLISQRERLLEVLSLHPKTVK